jgi:prolyl oligopeptidase
MVVSSHAGLPARDDIVDVLHGHRVPDPYRWAEDGDSARVQRWEAEERARYVAFTDVLPQREWLNQRFQELWRYDDETVPRPCLLSDREFFHTKRADQDKWVVHMRDGRDAPSRVVLDPNSWDETATLAGFWPSRDGRLAVYGRANAGDENPDLVVIDLDTLEELGDTTTGWRRGQVVWRHDAGGFWFSGRPAPGTVAAGAEHYNHRVWFHELGTSADDDVLVIADDTVKEHFHGVQLSEDGRWLIEGRFQFSASALWITDVLTGERRALTTDLDAEHEAIVLGDRIVIRTDWRAPRGRVMVTSIDAPSRESWTELVPEAEGTLRHVVGIGGRLYLTYEQNAASRVLVVDLDGTILGEVPWPTVGTASVSGFWGRPTVWASFQSFAVPPTVYLFDPVSFSLTEIKRSAIPLDPAGIVVEQVWFESTDGTRVSMFIVHREGAPRDGSMPFLLTGYGGFNISLNPTFSTVYATWVQLGGGVAIPNLRGGGEYGRQWHEAGKRAGKQNVFDDFIAAAEFLQCEGWTSSERLAISGGSNGGLLVSAAATQRPDLFAAVRCAVPLTDMIRFPRFGIAGIWTEEYGDPDDETMFPALLAYSPCSSSAR